MKENVYARLTVNVIHITAYEYNYISVYENNISCHVITLYLFTSIKKYMQMVDFGVRRCCLACFH